MPPPFRHRSMFMDDNGNIAYIDNDQAHGSAWRECGAPPLLLPAASQHMRTAASPAPSLLAKPQPGLSAQMPRCAQAWTRC